MSLAKHNAESPEEQILVRIGISAGEPVHNDEQLYGAAVNLAARLCAQAPPGSIWVAPVIRELTMGKNIPIFERGEFEPKGFDRPVPILEVNWMSS